MLCNVMYVCMSVCLYGLCLYVPTSSNITHQLLHAAKPPRSDIQGAASLLLRVPACWPQIEIAASPGARLTVAPES